MHALKLSETVTLLRGICNDRFKFEVEYGLKRGTSDNCYVLQVCPAGLPLDSADATLHPPPYASGCLSTLSLTSLSCSSCE